MTAETAVSIARRLHLYPVRHACCGMHLQGWGLPTTEGDDTTSDLVIWQCSGCGHYTTRDRRGVLAMARRAA